MNYVLNYINKHIHQHTNTHLYFTKLFYLFSFFCCCLNHLFQSLSISHITYSMDQLYLCFVFCCFFFCPNEFAATMFLYNFVYLPWILSLPVLIGQFGVLSACRAVPLIELPRQPFVSKTNQRLKIQFTYYLFALFQIRWAIHFNVILF